MLLLFGLFNLFVLVVEWIISLLFSIIEMVYVVGFGDKLVVVSVYFDYLVVVKKLEYVVLW